MNLICSSRCSASISKPRERAVVSARIGTPWLWQVKHWLPLLHRTPGPSLQERQRPRHRGPDRVVTGGAVGGTGRGSAPASAGMNEPVKPAARKGEAMSRAFMAMTPTHACFTSQAARVVPAAEQLYRSRPMSVEWRRFHLLDAWGSASHPGQSDLATGRWHLYPVLLSARSSGRASCPVFSMPRGYAFTGRGCQT